MKQSVSQEEQIIRLLADPRNRAILTILNDSARPVGTSELADRLVDRETSTFDLQSGEEEIEQALVSLHHNHLPKLAESGLVEYDSDANTVAYREFTTVDTEWMDLEMVDELLARFGHGRAEEDTIGVIEGREDVIARGQQLFEEANEELFLMFVTDGLLEEGCITRLQDAVERGVNVYLGSQTREVRDLIRRRIPGATIWEPQLDWLNVPSRSQKVGRLVFADREAIMLALLDEMNADGVYTETAMTGENADNPLVVLVRELLGPRLDHLDYQSENFRSEIPF